MINALEKNNNIRTEQIWKKINYTIISGTGARK